MAPFLPHFTRLEEAPVCAAGKCWAIMQTCGICLQSHPTNHHSAAFTATPSLPALPEGHLLAFPFPLLPHGGSVNPAGPSGRLDEIKCSGSVPALTGIPANVSDRSRKGKRGGSPRCGWAISPCSLSSQAGSSGGWGGQRETLSWRSLVGSVGRWTVES